jgi:hypothetical protein
MEETTLPRDKILTLLHEALTTTRADAEQFEQRLISLYRDEERPESTEQVVALGFLACTKALREASLMQEIAIREELQELHGLIAKVLTELTLTRQTVSEQAPQPKRSIRSLKADLSPSRRTDA